jgi:hypothetical protein
MFDGERYVTWSWHDESTTQPGDRTYLYDIQNPGEPLLLYPEAQHQVGPPVVEDGKVYVATWLNGVAEDFDIWVYDIASGTGSYLEHSPWDQLYCDVSGHVIAYLDTEELGAPWFTGGQESHIEIQDLETGVKRQITNAVTTYYGIGMSGKYLVFAASEGIHTLFACDLEAGGFVDAEGHVIPEGTVPDGGVDGGVDAGTKK